MANKSCRDICSADVIGGSFSRLRQVALVGSRFTASGSFSEPALEMHSFGNRCLNPNRGGRLQAVTNLSHLFCCSGVKPSKACKPLALLSELHCLNFSCHVMYSAKSAVRFLIFSKEDFHCPCTF